MLGASQRPSPLKDARATESSSGSGSTSPVRPYLSSHCVECVTSECWNARSSRRRVPMTSFRRTSTSFGFSVKFRESELKRNERYLVCSIVCHVRGYSLRYFAIFVILEGPEFLSRLSSFEAVAFVTRVTTKERVFLASKRYVSSLLEVCFLGSNEEAEREKRSGARDDDSFDKQSEILVIVARKLRRSRAKIFR